MSRLSTILCFLTSLVVVCCSCLHESPIPQTTPRLSLENIKRDDSQDTVVGWYTTASGAAWEINTCDAGSTWSTSGQYGACAPRSGQLLYTFCSGNWLVGGNGAFSQSCSSDWPACTTLYRATNFADTSPVTYLICDHSVGVSRRSVFAATTYPMSTATLTTPMPSVTQNPTATYTISSFSTTPPSSEPLLSAASKTSSSQSSQSSQSGSSKNKTSNNIALGIGLGISLPGLLLAIFCYRPLKTRFNFTLSLGNWSLHRKSAA